MSNIIRNTAKFSLYIVKNYAEKGDVLVDATCGKGNDTMQLLQYSPSKLYAFDIQKEALEYTKERLISAGYGDEISFGRNREKRINLICGSHSHMARFITEPVKAAVFNLGYLPGSDKALTTKPSSTLSAIKACLGLMKADGIVSITMYSGHPQGREEKKAVLDFAANLDKRKYHCAYINMLNQPKEPPEILLITPK